MSTLARSGAPAPVVEHPNDGLDPRMEHLVEGEEHRLRRTIVSLVLLGVVVLALVFAVPGLQDVQDRLRTVSPAWVAFAVILEIGSCFGYVFAFRKVFYRAPRRLAMRVALAELGFSAVVPAGGAGGIALGAWIIKAKGGSLARFMQLSAVLFLLTSAINCATLALAGLVVGVGILTSPHPLTLGLLPGLAGAIAIGGFLLVPRISRSLVGTDPGSRLGRWLHGTAEVVDDTRTELRRNNGSVLGSVAYLWLDIAVLWVCFRAFGATPSVGVLTLGYIIGYLGNLIPVPGGIGVLDGGLTAALVLYGLGASRAAAAVIVYHAIVLWIPSLLGIIAYARLHPTLTEPLKLGPERER